MLMHICNVGVGMTFSGGFIDLFLFGIMQGNKKTSWVWVVIIGVIYFIVYYFLFSFLIKKLNLKTPGRDDTEEVKLYTRADVNARKEGENSVPQGMIRFPREFYRALAARRIFLMWTVVPQDCVVRYSNRNWSMMRS